MRILILIFIFITSVLTQDTFDFKHKSTLLQYVKDDTAIINIGNLKVGQSGIIVHISNNKSFILAKAIVTSSSLNSSILYIKRSSILTQDAIPTTSLKPQKNDIFILNHMYNSSLLIVPNYEISENIKYLYSNQKFLNADIFAAYLKINSNPVPNLEDIQEFCKLYDIGTIFMVENNTLHILDVNSLKILNTITLNVKDTNTQSPFLTKVTKIEQGFWDFGDNEIKDYNQYYHTLINNSKELDI